MSGGSGVARMRANEDKHKIYGVVIGIVTKLSPDDDPIGHRVKLKFPFLSEEDESDWARIVTFGSGGKGPGGNSRDRGEYWSPEVGDEVVCAFEFGDIGRPYVIGTVWNGEEKPPDKYRKKSDGGGEKNHFRSIMSRSGHRLEFYDEDGKEKITIHSSKGAYIVIDDENEKVQIHDCAGSWKQPGDKMGDGENYMELDHKNKKITVESKTGDIIIKAKEKVQIQCKNLEVKSDQASKMESGANFDIKSSANLTMKASGQGELNASGTLTVKGATVNIN